MCTSTWRSDRFPSAAASSLAAAMTTTDTAIASPRLIAASAAPIVTGSERDRGAAIRVASGARRPRADSDRTAGGATNTRPKRRGDHAGDGERDVAGVLRRIEAPW